MAWGNCPPSMTNVTIKDIAAHLGISHPTVSRALRDHPSVRLETRQQVKQAAEALGYIPHSGARMLRRTRSELIGVIFPDVANDFYSRIMSRLSASFLQHGYKLVLATSEDRPEIEREQIRSLREARVAGIIIAPTASPHAESIRLLAATPTVQLLRRHPRLAAPAVTLDERAGIAMAVRHLAARSHVRIGYIGSSSQLSTGRERAQGYLRTLRSISPSTDPALLRQGPPRPDFGRRAMLELLSLAAPPTAVILAGPELAVGALAAIRERGIDVPGQLALIAYHDPDWFELWGPGISCIRLPVDAMASAAAALLLEPLCTGDAGMTARPAATPVSRFESNLIVRGSS